MIVKNEYVKIKTDKEVIIKNYIYDKYLEIIAQAQYDKSIMDFSMVRCYLKFDTAFDNIENKNPEDFDIDFMYSNRYLTSSENKVEANYGFTPSKGTVYDAKTGGVITDIEDYMNKRITAIGFSTMVNYQEYIVACVDTSNYSIYFADNITFQRKDVFMTDTTVSEGRPVHLAPFSEKTIIESTGHGDTVYNCYPVLYSIGLGTRRGVIDEEYIIGQDVDVVVESSNSFSLKMRRGLEPSKFPSTTLYSRNTLHPLPLKVTKELHPHKRQYTGSGIVPLIADYKYVMYRYRYYYYEQFMDEYIDIDEYFITNLPNDTKGLFKIITRIERSDV